MTDKSTTLVPEEGWHCVHLFYQIEHGQWNLLSREDQTAAKTNLPDWPVVCFYNMSKRRGEQRNWYALPFDERRKLMKGHATVGRQYAGKVKQLITGSTGLDDAEWGVTLFVRDTFQIKSIVYEMRFDPVSAEYADFGEFFIGIQLPLDELFRRLQL